MIMRFILNLLQQRANKKQHEIIQMRWKKAEIEKALDQKKRSVQQ